MKNIFDYAFFIIAIIFTSTSLYAQNTYQLTLNNHFDRTLNFFVVKNPEVLPDFLSTFSVLVNDFISSSVLDLGKEAYIRVEDDDNHSAFFGVYVKEGKTKVSGYISKGIAFSWREETVTFCTPEEYEKKQSC